MRVFCIAIFLFTLCFTVRPAFAESLSIAKELARPDVKLLVVEFYASWCKPCKEAIKNWQKQYKRFHPEGLRFIVISEDQPKNCANPVGLTPDRLICDQNEIAMQHFGVNKLPAIFLYSWDGKLNKQTANSDEVEKLVMSYMTNTNLKIVVDEINVIGDKYAISSNPDWLKRHLVEEFLRLAKFDIVVPSAARLPRVKSEGCPVNRRIQANSILRTTLQGDSQNRRVLTLELEKDGCILAAIQKPYNGKDFVEDIGSLRKASSDAVKALVESLILTNNSLIPKIEIKAQKTIRPQTKVTKPVAKPETNDLLDQLVQNPGKSQWQIWAESPRLDSNIQKALANNAMMILGNIRMEQRVFKNDIYMGRGCFAESLQKLNYRLPENIGVFYDFSMERSNCNSFKAIAKSKLPTMTLYKYISMDSKGNLSAQGL